MKPPDQQNAIGSVDAIDGSTDGSERAKFARHVLIVDDDQATARAVNAHLISAGYLTTLCHDGASALVFAEKEKPHAAVVDVHLGDISGLILAQRLRVILGDKMPIIMVSGDTSMETLNSLAAAGATYFLSKPMSPALLIQRLRDSVV